MKKAYNPDLIGRTEEDELRELSAKEVADEIDALKEFLERKDYNPTDEQISIARNILNVVKEQGLSLEGYGENLIDRILNFANSIRSDEKNREKSEDKLTSEDVKEKTVDLINGNKKIRALQKDITTLIHKKEFDKLYEAQKVLYSLTEEKINLLKLLIDNTGGAIKAGFEKKLKEAEADLVKIEENIKKSEVKKEKLVKKSEPNVADKLDGNSLGEKQMDGLRKKAIEMLEKIDTLNNVEQSNLTASDRNFLRRIKNILTQGPKEHPLAFRVDNLNVVNNRIDKIQKEIESKLKKGKKAEDEVKELASKEGKKSKKSKKPEDNIPKDELEEMQRSAYEAFVENDLGNNIDRLKNEITKIEVELAEIQEWQKSHRGDVSFDDSTTRFIELRQKLGVLKKKLKDLQTIDRPSGKKTTKGVKDAKVEQVQSPPKPEVVASKENEQQIENSSKPEVVASKENEQQIENSSKTEKGDASNHEVDNYLLIKN